MEDLNHVVMLLFALLLVWIGAPAAVAAIKGYEAWPWLLACGLAGVAALAFFPRVAPATPGATRWQGRASRLGLALSGVQLTALGAVCAVSAWRTHAR